MKFNFVSLLDLKFAFHHEVSISKDPFTLGGCEDKSAFIQLKSHVSEKWFILDGVKTSTLTIFYIGVPLAENQFKLQKTISACYGWLFM